MYWTQDWHQARLNSVNERSFASHGINGDMPVLMVRCRIVGVGAAAAAEARRPEAEGTLQGYLRL